MADATRVQKRHIGIYDLRSQDVGAGGSGKEALALTEHLSREQQVTLLVQRLINWRQVQEYFDVDLSRVRVVILPVPPDANPSAPDAATALAHRRQIAALDLDLFINKTYSSRFPCPAARGIFTCLFPHPLARWERPRPLANPLAWLRAWRKMQARSRSARAALDSYHLITANSGYTRAWVRRYWHRDATVVYSACEMIGPAGPKENWIVNVGRFEEREGVGAHYKRQGVMIDAFKRLTDLHAAGWELHLAGSAANDATTTAYVSGLQAAAAGYPIFFHFNVAQDDLHALYRRATLYWHATGYGLSAAKYPATQEHFGITTVEAMSAGVVPVVINSGGQRETVQHGVTGLLWDSLDELLACTRQLARDPAQCQTLREQALIACQQFSKDAYLRNMEQAIDQALAA